MDENHGGGPASALRLRDGIRLLRFGSSTLLFLGGRRVLHISGPVAPTSSLALLALLEDGVDPDTAIKSLDEDARECTWRSYRALRECGLLTDTRQPAENTPWGAFAARYADESAMSSRADISDLSEASSTSEAILRHAQHAAAAGLSVSAEIETDMFSRMLARQKSDEIAPAPPPWYEPPPHAGVECRIFWPLVGSEWSAGAHRWICPSAGNLKATEILVLRRRHGVATFETAMQKDGSWSLVRTLGRSILPEQLEPGDGAVCFMVSVLERLKIRYGARARNLAASDAGVANALLARSAEAEGWSAASVSVIDDTPLRRLLGITAERTSVAVSAIVRIMPHRPAAQVLGARIPLKRRSCRQFAPQPVGDFERIVSLARSDHARLHPTAAVRLIGLIRQAGGSYHLVDLAPRTEGRVLGADEAASLITQRDLRAAPLQFFCAAKATVGSASDLTSNAALLGSLWLRAADEGLVGTLCAAVDQDAARVVLGTNVGPLALCLGLPVEPTA